MPSHLLLTSFDRLLHSNFQSLLTLDTRISVTYRISVTLLFFHFRGNSERRVHVFLRHLEKMSHPFFEPKMGVLTSTGPFQQKKAKKRAKKFFEEREGNSISCPGKGNFLCRDRKWNFPPAV